MRGRKGRGEKGDGMDFRKKRPMQKQNSWSMRKRTQEDDQNRESRDALNLDRLADCWAVYGKEFQEEEQTYKGEDERMFLCALVRRTERLLRKESDFVDLEERRGSRNSCRWFGRHLCSSRYIKHRCSLCLREANESSPACANRISWGVSVYIYLQTRK